MVVSHYMQQMTPDKKQGYTDQAGLGTRSTLAMCQEKLLHNHRVLQPDSSLACHLCGLAQFFAFAPEYNY
jgi:hypothetical protein